MINQIEDILDYSLNELKKGVDLEQILFEFPDYSNELKPLLEAASKGMYIQKNIVPLPQKKTVVQGSKYS